MAAKLGSQILSPVIAKVPKTSRMGAWCFILGLVLVCLLWAQPVQTLPSSEDNNRVRKLLAVQQPSFRSHVPDIFTTTPAAGDAVISEWKIARGRALLVVNKTNFRPLALRNDRLDPFDHFNHYRNGYDVTSKHYWGSLAFTGISGYAIAVTWLVLGLLLLLFACCKSRLCGKRSRSKQPLSRDCHKGMTTAAVFVFLLSTIAVGCSVVLFVACKKLAAQSYNVEDVLVEAAHNATESIHSVSDTLEHVKGIVKPYNPVLYRSLNSTETKLNSLATVVNEKIFVKEKNYQKIFKIIEVVFLVVASLNVLLIVLGFASTILKWRRFFYLIIVVTWIFVALVWVMYGFFFSVHYLADDTCLAFKQYLQKPQNTTLDDLLPCGDLASSSTQYRQVRQSMKGLLAVATAQFLFYAKGSTSLTGVCDPIGPAPNYKYTGICANDTLPIGELSNILEPFVCNGTRSACLGIFPFYVNQSTYSRIAALTTASQIILDAFPQMEGLTNCSLVMNPINTMVNVRCGPAKVAINRIWVAFAVLSSIMILLLPSWWLAKCRHDQHRYNDTSVTLEAQDTAHTMPTLDSSTSVPLGTWWRLAPWAEQTGGAKPPLFSPG